MVELEALEIAANQTDDLLEVGEEGGEVGLLLRLLPEARSEIEVVRAISAAKLGRDAPRLLPVALRDPDQARLEGVRSATPSSCASAPRRCRLPSSSERQPLVAEPGQGRELLGADAAPRRGGICGALASSPTRATWRPAGAGAAARCRPRGTRRPSSTSRTRRRSAGPGDEVPRPPRPRATLDFELEIAAVVGAAGGEIAGFTLMNDWSARDVQRGGDDRGARAAQGQGLRHQRSAPGWPRRTSFRSTAGA